jgi:hypothetical protein
MMVAVLQPCADNQRTHIEVSVNTMSATQLVPRFLAAAIDACLHGPKACRGRSLHLLFGCVTLACTFVDPADVLASNTYVVTTSGDPGPVGSMSLREAVAAANGAPGVDPSDNIVQFAPNLVGSTITLTGGEIPIAHPLSIVGPGSDFITISGNDASRIFRIAGVDYAHQVHVNLGGLTLTRGHSDSGGGALLAYETVLRASDLVITASHAAQGGGMRVDRGSAYIDGARVRDNHATISGGGIEGYGNDVLGISHSTISGNSAGNTGGGVFANRTGHLQIAASLISGNVAAYGSGTEYSGGGIAVHNPIQCGFIQNSTITGNFATDGGGGVGILQHYYQSPSCKYFTYLVNDTIVGNSTQGGGGNGVTQVGATKAGLISTIVAGNFSPAGDGGLSGGFIACENLIKAPGSATLISLGAAYGCHANLIGVDPLLGPLRDNGGPTLSMLPDPASPVIDAGENTWPLSDDQRGLPRVGPDDIGAVERQFPEDLIFRDDFD